MIPAVQKRAAALLNEFKADRYAFGVNILGDGAGQMAAPLGATALVVAPIASQWYQPTHKTLMASLEAAGVRVVGLARAAAPNAPLEDVYRIHSHIVHRRPDMVIAVGGGSAIDAVKAASVLASLGELEPEIAPFFGVGQVSAMAKANGRSILPVMAVMMTASSGAHLTKYANVTDPAKGQKKLIVDEAIVPPRAIFDYAVTQSQPMNLTLDGGLDGIAHLIEVFYGAGVDTRDHVAQIVDAGLDAILTGLNALRNNPSDLNGRLLLGLGTDLGGYAIMIGGTSGAHLNSFSLVDVLSHGRACALMNPYYTVFFAPAIEAQLRIVGAAYQRLGYLDGDLSTLNGRDLGMAVATAMIRFSEFLGFPTCLDQVDGIGRHHVARCLAAAKDPQLDMKLRNMPVPLHAGIVDEFMGPVLEAAWDGDLDRIRTM